LAVWNLLPVHNSFLLVLAEYGIFGFGLLFALFAVFSKQIKKNNWLFVPVIAALLVSGLFEHFWWTLYAGQMAWWAVWALGLAVL
jgi:O-antigen ligase